MKEHLEKLSTDDIHNLMMLWMAGLPEQRKEAGMNEPPKQMRKRWRMGQIKKAMKEKSKKSAKRAKDDLEATLRSVHKTQERAHVGSWKCTLAGNMSLGSAWQQDLLYHAAFGSM